MNTSAVLNDQPASAFAGDTLCLQSTSEAAQNHKVFKKLAIPLKTYSWDQARHLGLKTRGKWGLELRKVRNGEKPAAILDEADSKWGRAKFFRLDQTRPWNPTPRTRACLEFEKIFLEPCRRDHYMRYDPEADICRQRKVSADAMPGSEMNEAKIRRHLNGTDIFGVAAGYWTRFVAIDLDFHGRDRSVFLEQAEILLPHLNKWHFQVARDEIDGLHAYLVYSDKQSADHAWLREKLSRLDAKHPELASRAVAAGMAPFSRMEIYPVPNHAFRLPLCRGRIMLLDRPLEPIQIKGRLVGDVEAYIAWVQDPDRQRMPADEILDHLERNLGPSYQASQPVASACKAIKPTTKPLQKPPKPTKPSFVELSPEDHASGKLLGVMKRQFRKKLVGFYSGDLQIIGSLNVGITLGAHACWTQEMLQLDAQRLLMQYLLEIPNPEFSSRLKKKEIQELKRNVETTVSGVYFSHRCPLSPDDHRSNNKLLMTRHAWQMAGFRFDDKRTWNACWAGKGQCQQIMWSDDDKERIIKQVNNILKIKDTTKVLDVVNGVLGIVEYKSITNDGIAISYWKMFLEDEFGLNCGHHGKVNALLDVLQEKGLELIRVTQESQFFSDGRKGRAKQYGLSNKVLALLT